MSLEMLHLESNRHLRALLKLEGLDSDQHLKEIEGLRAAHTHTIRFVEKRRDQTCATYAFSLTDDPTYRAVAGLCNIYAGKEFMRWAIDSHLQEVSEPHEGCLVSYFFGAEWKHIGVIVDSARVVSKWGTYPLYEHALAEVPEDYGSQVAFYARPSPAEAPTLFIEFARECGLSDADIARARSRWRE
jgi:hypothetical protein